MPRYNQSGGTYSVTLRSPSSVGSGGATPWVRVPAFKAKGSGGCVIFTGTTNGTRLSIDATFTTSSTDSFVLYTRLSSQKSAQILSTQGTKVGRFIRCRSSAGVLTSAKTAVPTVFLSVSST